MLQGERDAYFAQLERVEALAERWAALPGVPGPLVAALREVLYDASAP